MTLGPFALSVPGYRLGVHSQKPHKRRRHDDDDDNDGAPQRDGAGSRSPSPHVVDYSDAETLFSSSASRLPSEAINPLSHSPDTLRQLAVAGLSPEDELPSRAHPGFPHRPLPLPLPLPRGTRGGRVGRTRMRTRTRARTRLTGNDDDDNDDDDAESGEVGVEIDSTATTASSRRQKYSARVRHLNTVTAIMHRCLRDGDVARAKRALGLVVRTRHVDLRRDHLWAIGLEILMRDGEREEGEREGQGGEGSGGTSRAKKPPPPPSSPSHGRARAPRSAAPSGSGSNAGSDVDMVDREGEESEGGGQIIKQEEDEDEDEEEAEEEREREEEAASQGSAKANPNPPERWGSAANLPQVKTYLETLIQQHPYDAQRPHATSAADFWPALFGVEVHGLDAEFRIALHQIRAEHGFPSPSSSRDSSPGPGPGSGSGSGLGRGAHEMGLDREHEHGGGEGYGVDVDADGGDLSTSARTWRRRETKRRHEATDALRAETRRGALEIAARMDAVLENVPYSSHGELLRLRAHVALFVGDLYLPSRLVESYAARRRRGEGGPGTETGGSLREAERRLRVHARTPDERVALARRAEEQRKAVAFFKRVVAARGRLEDWVAKLLDAEDDDEEED
ncbi:hypothetical protein F5Y14DRAFT_338299 [Nemania sp. NC0429]|nr:hypothetical protein F5Y14DRAFT_338299 [Nemania sp. NC0429]